jgi:hypothetical protein
MLAATPMANQNSMQTNDEATCQPGFTGLQKLSNVEAQKDRETTASQLPSDAQRLLGYDDGRETHLPGFVSHLTRGLGRC